MSRKISDSDLETLHVRTQGEVRHVVTNNGRLAAKGLPPKRAMIYVDGQTLLYVLDELRQRRNKPKQAKLGANTLALMAMAVGDVIELDPVTQSSLTTSRQSARKQLGIPDARWHAETLASGKVRVERMPDGSPHIFGRTRNPVIDQMAALHVGRSLKFKGPMYAALKIKAREKMKNPEANWRCENLVNGKVRVTRTK